MPQKNAKKAKSAKPVKPAKAHKTAPPVSSVLKKAAKVVAKKVVAVVAKKPVPAKKAIPVKAKAPEKKVAAPVIAKGKAVVAPNGKKAASPAPAPVKDKKVAAPVAPEKAKTAAVAKPAAVKGAKGKAGAEVVLEVPAPKGVALLGRESKKAKKSAESLAAAKRRCREPGCEHDFILTGYCRMHYIKNWRKIKRKEAILASGQLNNYVEELVSKYPDKYLDVIRQDLASEKDWSKVVVDLELDSVEDETGGDEEAEGAVEGVRTGTGRGDFEDDSDSF
ncbi:MAG: hypothetical protein ACXWQO_07035 [Bdellovibrionota bacterium]